MEYFTIDDIRKVYELLEDEASKDIYVAKLNWFVTHEYKYMRYIIEKYVPQVPVRNGLTISDLRRLLPANRKIIIYGAGENAKAYLDLWKGDERLIGFCDRDAEKQKKGLKGYPVIKPEELLKMENVSVVISISASEEIRNFLLQSDFPEDRIYEMAPYIFCTDTGQYFNPDFMTFGEEVFVDAGCKNLSTALKLTKYCSHLKKVYAFEPDDSNYHDCMKSKAAFTEVDVEVFHYGTWSKAATLHFSTTADGSSHICEDGETSIEVMSIDEAVAGKERVTFIKMDVEGAELESLKGARNTIQRDKPKLAICIYHKPEDMVTIPLYIKQLVPEYKLYVRHHSNVSGETVLYAVTP